MRPKQIDIDVADESLTGFASNVTGATWTLTATACTDGLAHQVSIRNDSATNHSAKTATLVGTDADGRAQTETINLPNTSATVESTKYFKTLTSVTPSATIGADTMDIGWVDEVSSPTYIVDYRSGSPVSISVDVTGTLNFDVEVTLQDPYLNGTAPFDYSDQESLFWVNDGNFTAKTADTTDDVAMAGIRAYRIVLNSYSSGAELQAFVTQPYNVN